jgi:hypothetical protein
MILYEHFNTVTGDGYVGVTKNSIKNRNREHFYLLRKGKHFNPRFQRAFDKYGEKAFQLKIRATFDTVDAMNMAEVETVEKEKNRLYNIAPGGNSGFHELEAKKKIAVALSKPMVSMNIKTGEIREYSSGAETARDGFDPRAIGGACRLSQYESDKYKTYGRISHHGCVWMYKKDFNLQEMERRRQLAIRGKIRLERSVIGKSLKNGEIVEFKSASEAGRNGFNMSNVYAVCRDVARSHNGFVWCYTDIPNYENVIEEKFINYTNRPPKTGPKKWQS